MAPTGMAAVEASWQRKGAGHSGERGGGGGGPRFDAKGGKKGGKGGGDGGGKDPERRGRRDKIAEFGHGALDFSPGEAYGGYGGAYDGGYGQGMQAYWGWQPLPPPPTWCEYADPDGVPYYYNTKTGLCQWERPAELERPKPVSPPPAEPAPAAAIRSGGGGAAPGGTDEAPSRREGERKSVGGGGGDGGKGGGRRRGREDGGKKEGNEFGPPGCNLFVFHLPDDWQDEDLLEYFQPHGSVSSAKVMKEIGTGRSRGFGFVSYEDRVSAATAIKKMQGYKILGKRLKVEFKKGEGDSAQGLGEDAGRDGEDGSGGKAAGPDDERLIGYLRAISAQTAVKTLRGSEAPGSED